MPPSTAIACPVTDGKPLRLLQQAWQEDLAIYRNVRGAYHATFFSFSARISSTV
jgi:hypothetical protein